MQEHPHRSRGREDVIAYFQERGELGKGITFEVLMTKITNKKMKKREILPGRGSEINKILFNLAPVCNVSC